MNALDFDKLSDIEKSKLQEYCNKSLNKRRKLIFKGAENAKNRRNSTNST